MQLLPILTVCRPCSGEPYISEQVLVRPPGAYIGGPGQPFVAEERSLYFAFALRALHDQFEYLHQKQSGVPI